MLFLISILIACVFSWFCAKPLKKHAGVCYSIGAILTVIMCILGQMHLQTASIITNITNLFQKGTLACAFWCIVAGMGALPNGSAAIKKLMPIRGELSIFSAIITLSHVITYGIVYLQRLLNGSSDLNFILTCIISLLLLIIMIPLTILSFKTIRKKLNARTWKRIQRLAYLFYALIYAHVMIIYIPRAKLNREDSLFSIIIYTAVFAGYAIFRIRKEFIKKQKPENKALLNIVCMSVLVIATASMGLVSKAKEKPLETAEQITTELATEFSTTVPETIPEMITTTEANSTQAETENLESETTENNTENNTETSEIATTAEMKATSDTQSVATETITQASTVLQQDNVSQSPVQEETQIDIIDDEQNDNQILQQEPEITDPEPVIPEPIMTEPEPEISNTIYHDGTYTAEAFGYDSMVSVTITIENDIITDITATCNESDMYYFEEAYPVIKSRILDSQNATVDAVSGSTYSSNAIMSGVQKALDSARK